MELRLLARRGHHIARSEGLVSFIKRLLRFAYNRTVRPLLPTTGYRTLNGVIYQERKVLDSVLPWSYQSDDPEYEDEILAAVRTHTKEGDDVCIVGGGLGISTVESAHRAGPSGTVTVFEGSAYRTDVIVNVLDLNEVPATVELRHGIVGPDIKIHGEVGEPDAVDPADLPECDVLEMDCEGAELGILENLEFEQPPRVIVVEVHPELGSEEAGVRTELERRGYEIIRSRVEREEGNIKVLTAVQSDAH